MKSKKVFSVIALFVAAFIWGTAFSAQKIAAENGMGNFYFNGVRFLIGSVSLVFVAAVFSRKNLRLRKTVFPSLLAGTVLFCASNLQQFGIDIGKSAGKASFITGLYIILVPFALFLFFRRRPRLPVFLGALAALAGLYLISVKPGEGVGLGDVLLLIGALFWTAHIIVIDRFAADCDPIVFSLMQFFVAGILSMIAAFLFEDVSLTALSGSLAPVLYTGVFSSGVAYTCQVIGQKHTEPAAASIILSGEALFGAISGIVINGEVPDERVTIGAALMFFGIVFSQVDFSRKKRA